MKKYLSASSRIPLVIVLDNVRSLNNVGSIFRTADGFSVEAVYLCGITGTPPRREIEKTALGATASVPWKYFDATAQAVRSLQQSGYFVIGIEQGEGSIALHEFSGARGVPLAVVFGHEVRGVGEEIVRICDCRIEVPLFGVKRSLNVSVAAGIVVWEFSRRMRAAL